MATFEPRTASWFTYFPEDYGWSSAVCGVPGSAPWGGSDIGEVKELGGDEAWFEAWRAEGARVRALAEAAESGGRRMTASAACLRACNYYQMAERFRTPKDTRVLATRPDVDPRRVGVMAIGLDGYYAPRCASMDPRFKACVARGAIWDYHATWKRRVEAGFRASMSVPGHHIAWITGAAGQEDALHRRRGGLGRQDLARLHHRGRGLPALPARLPEPRHQRHLRLAGREALNAHHA